MNTRSIIEYIHMHGGALRAYKTYLEEQRLAIPGTSLDETITQETRLLAQLSPLERLHRVMECLAASVSYLHLSSTD